MLRPSIWFDLLNFDHMNFPCYKTLRMEPFCFARSGKSSLLKFPQVAPETPKNESSPQNRRKKCSLKFPKWFSEIQNRQNNVICKTCRDDQMAWWIDVGTPGPVQIISNIYCINILNTYTIFTIYEYYILCLPIWRIVQLVLDTT